MPQHGKYIKLGSESWKSAQVPASELATTDKQKYKYSGYFLKDIYRSWVDSEVDSCSVHITVNCSNGDRIRTKYWLNCPHVTFEDNGYKTHVYYNFTDNGSLVYQYTDNTTDEKWRKAAYVIMRDETGWGNSVLNPFS